MATEFEKRLKSLGFKTKGYPDHARRRGLEIIERALNGQTVQDLGGHRHHKDRSAVVVHVGDYVVVLYEQGDRLTPTDFVPRQKYEKMFR